MQEVIEKVKLNVALVHGYRSNTFVAAHATFYIDISVGQMVAGLRTYDIYTPFTEEFNRQAIVSVGQYYFAHKESYK